jgi:hypothetical protein
MRGVVLFNPYPGFVTPTLSRGSISPFIVKS